MKNILIIFFLFISWAARGQDYPDDGLDRVRIVEKDRIIQADIKPVNGSPKPKPDRFYFWYSANAVHVSQGGFSGDLLNGLYNEYYLNRNLKSQGIFKKGLKDGTWKSWKEDGTLSEVITWKNGVIVPENTVPLLKRLNLFRKREKKKVADTTAKKTVN